MYTKKCDGACGALGFHTHHLSTLGKWHFIYRYGVQDALFGDQRAQPPVVFGDDAEQWFPSYLEDWKKQFKGYDCPSCWVREESGYWVWVTDTPVWDRDWFDKRGWQFPAKWITAESKKFYTVGSDDISVIINLREGEELDKR